MQRERVVDGTVSNATFYIQKEKKATVTFTAAKHKYHTVNRFVTNLLTATTAITIELTKLNAVTNYSIIWHKILIEMHVSL